MASIGSDDPPRVHDLYLSQAEHDGSVLRLLLRRRAYSEEKLDVVAVWEGWLSFRDVTDIDARPGQAELDDTRAGNFIDRSLRRVFRTYDTEKLGTVRNLMAELAQGIPEVGTPLSGLELLGTGYVLVTSLVGSYFIRASSASLSELSR